MCLGTLVRGEMSLGVSRKSIPYLKYKQKLLF